MKKSLATVMIVLALLLSMIVLVGCGENGRTPVIEIGENGNWFIDGVDTEVKAQVKDGDAGLSAYELYVKYHPEYDGSEEEWIATFYPTPVAPNEIVSVTKTATEGLVDTYTITFTNGSTTTFTVNNGENGRTPVIEIGENGNWFIDGVDTEVKAQVKDGNAGLSAYELYVKYHPEYEGSEEEWVNEFFRNENDLEIFVRQMDVSSYTAEMSEYFDGELGNNQVFAKYENIRYWKEIYNEYDEETGDYYLYPLEYYYITDNDDAANPDSLLCWKQSVNEWRETTDDADIYADLNQCYMRRYQYEIDPLQFEQVTSTYYRAKADCVTAVGKAFFCDMDIEHWGELDGIPQRIRRTETFSSFELEIVSGNLKVRATSRIEDGDNSADITYELVLSKMAVTTLSVPEYVEEPEDGFPADTIADCYEKIPGEAVVNLWGAVTGYAQINETDWNVWLTDYEERDILVVFRGFGFPYGVEVGRLIVVCGKINISDGLRSVLVTRRVDYELQGNWGHFAPSVTDFSEITSNTVSTVVDLEGVALDKTALDGEDTVILTDRAGNTLELLVSQNEVALFNAICADISAGDEVNLKNVAITKDYFGIYACMTKQCDIELEHGLLLNYSEKVIGESLSLEDALADLVVHYRGDDNKYVLLEKSDYTLTCEGYDSSENGVFEVSIVYGEEEAVIDLIVYLPEVRENVSYQTLEETAEEKLGYILPSLPSAGDVNILVIPIGFTNTDYEKYGSEEQIKAKLELAFNDTEGRTGWYSLKEYYQAASYGKLNFNAKIMDIYQTGEAYDITSGETGVDDLEYIVAALGYYDDEIDYSEYDQNGDWNIDCVYVVYLAPACDSYDDEQSDMWWAYYFYDYNYQYCFDDTYVYGYLWMSIDFFDLPIDIEYTGYDEIDTENSLYVDVNCEAVIHETGHALGLDDYYDYELGGVKGGTGAFPMMDTNQGDHDPYSKAILGWTNPTVVVNKDYEATLRSFEATGDTIILSKINGGTYFEEYYMIAFYTPTGVNELKCDRECGLPSVPGVMVWHINATLRNESEFWRVTSVADITKYNNGSAAYKLIDLVCADGSGDIDRFVDYVVQDKDIYAAGSSVSGLKWHDGTSVNVEIAVGEFVDNDGVKQVTISIDYQ